MSNIAKEAKEKPAETETVKDAAAPKA